MRRPARSAGLKSVVDAEHIPPPTMPFSGSRTNWPLRMNAPLANGGTVTGTIESMNWNILPGLTTMPLIRFAGTVMFTPLPLSTLGMKCVVHFPSNVKLPGTPGELDGFVEGVGLSDGVAVGVGVGVGASVGVGVGVAVGVGVGVGVGVSVGVGVGAAVGGGSSVGVAGTFLMGTTVAGIT